jgi:hypothetical protein
MVSMWVVMVILGVASAHHQFASGQPKGGTGKRATTDGQVDVLTDAAASVVIGTQYGEKMGHWPQGNGCNAF